MFNRATLPKKAPEKKKAPSKQAVRNEPPLTVSVDEMGRMLGISRKTAFKLAHQPGFPSVRIGGRIVISVRALQAWIDAQTAGNLQ